MKSKNIILTVLIIAAFLMNSCASKMFYTTLDVLKPAEITFPLNINNIVIVNNSLPQPSNVGHSTVNISGKKTNEIILFDSAAIFTTAALSDALNSQGFFNNVNYSLINQNLTKNRDSANILSKERVKTLCKMFNADAVMALNKIELNDCRYEVLVENDEVYKYINEIDVKTKTDWTIYPLDGKNTNIQYVDSFLWQTENYDRKIAYEELPSRYDALVDASILSGANIAERMMPRWEKEDRYFFVNNNKSMKQAMDSVSYRKWDKAIELWKNATEKSKSNKIKYQSYCNIATAYEILGNIDQAIYYIQQALETISKNSYAIEKDGFYIVSYEQNLLNRKNEMKILKQQIGN